MDDTCKCTLQDLEYSKTYGYIIYAYKQSDGALTKSYYTYGSIILRLPNVRLPGINYTDEVDTSKSKIAVTLEIPDDIFLLTPDYLEVTRRDVSTDKTKKFKVAWTDFEKTRALRNPDPSVSTNMESAIFTDDTVKAGHTYEYSFQTSATLNGEKIYSLIPGTVTLSAYNYKPIVDVEVKTKVGKSTSTITVKLTSQKDNAPLVVGNKVSSYNLQLYAPGSTGSYSSVKLSEISYDGKNWIKAKDSLYIILEENETIYLKIKVKGTGLDVTDKRTLLRFGVGALYYPDRGIIYNGGDIVTCKGNLTKKTYKNLVAK